MVSNTNEISGKGMAVIVGALLIVSTFFAKLGFGTELGMWVLGIILIILGVKD